MGRIPQDRHRGACYSDPRHRCAAGNGDTVPETGPDGQRRPLAATSIEVCDQGIADKLAIPVTYLRRMPEHKSDLYDATSTTGWSDSASRFLLRCLRPANAGGSRGGPGVLRLRDHRQPGRADADLDSFPNAGFPIEIDGCDPTERRRYVRGSLRASPGARLGPARRMPQPVHRRLRHPQPRRLRRVRDHQPRIPYRYVEVLKQITIDCGARHDFIFHYEIVRQSFKLTRHQATNMIPHDGVGVP
jgi:hypothetical protein